MGRNGTGIKNFCPRKARHLRSRFDPELVEGSPLNGRHLAQLDELPKLQKWPEVSANYRKNKNRPRSPAMVKPAERRLSQAQPGELDPELAEGTMRCRNQDEIAPPAIPARCVVGYRQHSNGR